MNVDREVIGLDIEQLQILLLRRYNVLKDIGKLTDDLREVTFRNDRVSASLVLEMRAEAMERYEKCKEQIGLFAEQGEQEAEVVKRLVFAPLESVITFNADEQKIYEIRKKAQKLLHEIQEKDRFLNKRVAGKKSFYKD